jgi:hypothetical protein
MSLLRPLARLTLAILLGFSCASFPTPASEAPSPLLSLEAMKGWTALETAHFRFHFPPVSVVGDQKAFAAEEEAALAKLLTFFGGTLPGKVDFFVWNNDEDGERALGHPLAFAGPDGLAVYTSPDHSRGHELTHIVLWNVIKPVKQSTFIEEGTAVALDQSMHNLLASAQDAVRRTGARSISILALIDLEDADGSVIYPVGGAFVERLIATGGRERFLDFLHEQTIEHARAVYGVEFDTLVATFENELVSGPAKSNVAMLRATAKARMAREKDVYSGKDLSEIEKLYQSGNWNTAEGRKLLQKLVDEYPKSNRAGCAMLYLARKASGKERETLLLRAISDYDDSWYGDGTQVGPYARTLLALTYAHDGRKDEARKLAEQVATQTPDAVEHTGSSLVASLRENGLLP